MLEKMGLKTGTLLTDGNVTLCIVDGLKDRIDYARHHKIHYNGYVGKVLKWEAHPERVGQIEIFGETMIETCILEVL